MVWLYRQTIPLFLREGVGYLHPLFAVGKKVVMKIRAIDYSVCFLLGVFLLVGCCNVATGSLAGDLSGDGMVDLSDLRLFAGQWLDGPQYPPQGLLAHWQFDEDDSLYAIDSTSNGYTGDLIGGVVHIDEGGLFGKVLQFDGADDYVIVPYVLNPYFGPFSAFAWVKGGAAKEVIISQADNQGVGMEWLHTDPTDGKLLTRLTSGGSALTSEAVITDGNWHHIGIVWDGSRRYLYADGAEVASDPSPLSGKLYWCNGDLHIGAGNTEPLEDYHFWSGQIDDVRIYSRAVSAAEIDLMANPSEPELSSADLDGNMRVDFADFAILARNWRIDTSGEYRCIWVDSWNWNRSFMDSGEANELIQTCRDNNINTVIVEVRKVGDASYFSNIEPRIESYIAGGPSFDPLGYLIDIAHDTSGGKKFIEVHAWFVAHRILKTTTPYSSEHVLSLHPEFATEDASGNQIADNSYYLDPGHPGAVDWNVAVILDCLQNYDIDGINLDYIRYPGPTWGYNATSIARYNAFHGTTGTPSGSAWSDWRRECVTLEVKKIYVKSLMIDQDVVVTTDTVAWGGAGSWLDFESSRPYSDVFQDWAGWLRAGIIDYNTLMGYMWRNRYLTEPQYTGWYEGWCKVSLDNDDIRGSILSTGAYKQHAVQEAVDQLLDARSWGAAGLNIYDWYSEVSENESGETRADFYRELKAQVFPEWVDPPTPGWKVRPTRGIFEGSLRVDGFSVDHGTVEIEGQPETRVYTDGTGWYAIMEIPPGEYRLRFSNPGYSDVVSAPTLLTAGQIITVDADL